MRVRASMWNAAVEERWSNVKWERHCAWKWKKGNCGCWVYIQTITSFQPCIFPSSEFHFLFCSSYSNPFVAIVSNRCVNIFTFRWDLRMSDLHDRFAYELIMIVMMMIHSIATPKNMWICGCGNGICSVGSCMLYTYILEWIAYNLMLTQLMYVP